MSRRSITAATLTLTLLLLAACGGGLSLRGGGDRLSYAQFRSQGEAVRGLSYACEDSEGKGTILRMVFDRRGRLEKWALGDARSP